MTTLNELVETIGSALRSFTGVQEQVTFLTGDATAGDLAIYVFPTESPVRGIVEIGDELIYVLSGDATGASLAIPPFGRGYRGSIAAAHSTNDMVTIDPAFPRVEVIRAINAVIESVKATLYQIKTITLEYNATVIGYDMPNDCEQVIDVAAHIPDAPENFWHSIPRWTFDTLSLPPETFGGAGNTLNLYHPLTSGVTVRVTYRAKFLPLTVDFATSGIPESYADLLLYGVAARMIRFLDPARVQLNSVENISRAQVTQSGDSGRTANQMYAMFQSRVAEERRRLLELTPVQSNYLSR